MVVMEAIKAIEPASWDGKRMIGRRLVHSYSGKRDSDVKNDNNSCQWSCYCRLPFLFRCRREEHHPWEDHRGRVTPLGASCELGLVDDLLCSSCCLYLYQNTAYLHLQSMQNVVTSFVPQRSQVLPPSLNPPFFVSWVNFLTMHPLQLT